MFHLSSQLLKESSVVLIELVRRVKYVCIGVCTMCVLIVVCMLIQECFMLQSLSLSLFGVIACAYMGVYV